MNNNPPKCSKWILEKFLIRYSKSPAMGDLEEEFEILVDEVGLRMARMWYRRQVLKSIPACLNHWIYWNGAMLNNYLKIVSRNIKRHKGYSFINIMGLAVGMACCIMMLLWVQDELSWDRFHENGDHIFRVIAEQQTIGETILNARTPDPLLPALRENFPEIVDAIRFQGFDGWVVSANGKTFTNDDLGTADPSFFEMFSFPFIQGDPKTALQDRYSIVITEDMANKYFGTDDPMGKIIDIGIRFKVTGVIKNIPHNSHLHFDCIFPIINMEDCWEEDFEDWDRIAFYTYIQLEENSPVGEVNQKISDVVRTYHPESNIERIFLQPLHRIHLYSNYQWDLDNYNQSDISFVYIFAITALTILLIACINFMNLSTARAGQRAREVGMRKVVGARRTDIIKQFFGEAILLAFVSLCFALVMASLFLPVFNGLTGKQLTLEFTGNLPFIAGLGLITLFTGMVSASYPALFISSFRPVKVLKGASPAGTGHRSRLRKALVVFQFTLTIVLIIGTGIVHNQLDYMVNRDLGFDKDHILYFPMGFLYRDWAAAKQALLQNPNILYATNSYPPNGKPWASTDFDWEGKKPEEKVVMYPYGVDEDYLNTFRMRMADGRFFSKAFATDTAKYVINEAAVRAMGMTSPVGRWVSYGGRKGQVIGVIGDFHQSSLHGEIEPLILEFGHGSPYTCIKIRSENVSGTLRYIEDVWNKFAAEGRPFQYEFLDLAIERFYKTEQKIGKVFRYFTVLMIFISCLGLFGLASFTAEQRTKEIGIRKVMGASVSKIMLMLSTEFIKWVAIANVFAWPVAYFLMRQFLRNFAYRIHLSLEMFVFSGLLALVVALVTVSSQSARAARANPVNSLRYE